MPPARCRSAPHIARPCKGMSIEDYRGSGALMEIPHRGLQQPLVEAGRLFVRDGAGRREQHGSQLGEVEQGPATDDREMSAQF
ncbi:hypothetical protein GCM10010264_20030 [Streptomyces globisporus]|nr:hypothetical protein GCM10010264_20030 [Streptomyces globisporus]